MDIQYNKDYVNTWSLYGHHDYVLHYILARAPHALGGAPDAATITDIDGCIDPMKKDLTPENIFKNHCLAAALSFTMNGGPYDSRTDDVSSQFAGNNYERNNDNSKQECAAWTFAGLPCPA